ncbi:MAG: glycosyl transferase, partial [Phycisphaerales bacterium]
MNWLDLLALIGLAIAAFAAIMTLRNLQCLRKPEAAPDHPDSPLVVCIPARNESANIEDCVRSVLGGGIEQLTVLIYD